MDKCVCSLLNIFHVVHTSTIDMVSGLILFSSLHLLFVSFPLCLRAIQLQIQLGTWTQAHTQFMACLMAMEFHGFLNCSSINAERHLLRSASNAFINFCICMMSLFWFIVVLVAGTRMRSDAVVVVYHFLANAIDDWQNWFSLRFRFEFYCSEQPTRMH